LNITEVVTGVGQNFVSHDVVPAVQFVANANELLGSIGGMFSKVKPLIEGLWLVSV
jgi:hypothetical protein